MNMKPGDIHSHTQYSLHEKKKSPCTRRRAKKNEFRWIYIRTVEVQKRKI